MSSEESSARGLITSEPRNLILSNEYTQKYKPCEVYQKEVSRQVFFQQEIAQSGESQKIERKGQRNSDQKIESKEDSNSDQNISFAKRRICN